MPRPRLPDRVVGAYPDDKRRPDGPWSVVLVLDGRRVTERAAGESEARRLEARYRRDLSTEVRTAQDALEEWITWKAATIKPVSVAALRSSLPRFLGPVLGLPLTALRGKAEDLYARAVSLFAVVTQRLALQRAKEWGAWLVRKRWLTVNPFAHVEPVGRPNVGKPQLREDEAALFLQKALEIWDAGRTWAAIPAVLLLLGTRVSETQAVEVRDLDRGGAVLWIAKSKTDAGKRRLAVPDVLRERLLRLAEGKGPHELLFSPKVQRQAIPLRVRRLCALAGVPPVCAHSLRGLHATLATEAGATAQVVAAQLGHAGAGITKAAYIAPGTTERVAARAVELRLVR